VADVAPDANTGLNRVEASAATPLRNARRSTRKT
jgi:hypothetical protein